MISNYFVLKSHTQQEGGSKLEGGQMPAFSTLRMKLSVVVTQLCISEPCMHARQLSKASVTFDR